MQSKIIDLIKERINELQNQEWQAKEAKDYVACLHIYGAIICLKKLLKEVEGLKDEQGTTAKLG